MIGDHARIGVGIADDQPLVRAGLSAMIGQTDDLLVIGEAANGREAIELARAFRPRVLLMDVRMPEMDGIAATAAITADPAVFEVKVVLLTTFDLDEYVYAGLRAGASGFLLKDAAPEELFHAIRAVAEGGALLAPSVTRRLIGAFARATPPAMRNQGLGELTERETEVLTLVGRGLSNGEIATRLRMSPATAKTHVGRIFTKLGVHDRAQLVVTAYESGLVQPGLGE